MTRAHLRRLGGRLTRLTRSRALVPLAVLSAVLVVVPGASAVQSLADSPSDQDEVAVAQAVTKDLAKYGAADFWVAFEDKADLGKADDIEDWAERGEYVYEQLAQTAQASQAELIEDLRSQGVEYESFWIGNVVLVRNGDQQALDTARGDPEVSAIRADEPIELPDPIEDADHGDARVNAVEWGIANIHADDVWNQFGVRGEGVVVGNIDSGVDYTHPALVEQYRGNSGGSFNHDYNWWDPSHVCADPLPCDNNSHGTHTMGTMVGDDGAGNQVGVAPAAQWIAAKGCESGSCSSAALLSSGQFMLAPTKLDGSEPRPELRPHIINNSWGGANGPAVDPWYRDIVTAWTAAGIFGVFANGNSGPGCDTTGSPGDYVESWGVGAYDSSNTIAGFSSRGPGEGGLIKPDISAPGVGVRSSAPGGGYALGSGTSMATPHVSGAVALLWAANPSLVGDIEGSRALLDLSAVDTPDDQCGGAAGDNNVYGQGRLDALAAVTHAAEGTGKLIGTVTDADTGQSVDNATVSVTGPIDWETRTGPDGSYSLLLVAGEYEVGASKYGYADATRPGVQVSANQTTTQDLALTPVPSGTVSGTVTDGSGHGWPLHAKVEVADVPLSPRWTDPHTGEYSLTLAEGDYTLTVSTDYPGYETQRIDVTVGGGTTTEDVALPVDTATCDAPGYGWDGLRTEFSRWAGNTTHDGWAVRGTRQGWTFDNHGDRPPPGIRPTAGVDEPWLLGADEEFAIVDSAFHGAGGRQDTALVSPSVDLTEQDAPKLEFHTIYRAYGDRQTASVDLSVDGGRTWGSVWHRDTDSTVAHVEIPIPEAAGEPDVRVRFVFTGRHGWYWAIDDVFVGTRTCVPIEGGLVAGTVTDLTTGDRVNGARITGDATVGEPGWPEGISLATADSSLPGGYYWLFAPTTAEQFTATALGYKPATATVPVRADDVTRHDWALIATQEQE